MEKVARKNYKKLLQLTAKCIETLNDIIKEYGDNVQAEQDRYKALFELLEDLEESNNELRKLVELDVN